MKPGFLSAGSSSKMPGRLSWIIFSKGGHSHEPVSAPISGTHRDPSGNVPRLSSGKRYLRQKPLKLTAWLFPLLLGLCISGGFLSCFFQISTLPVLFLLLPLLLFLYHKTLRISIWKSGSIFLAVCAVLPASTAFPGGKCHYNCQPQSDRKRTVVSDQIRPLLQRNLFKLRSGYLVSCLPCGKKYDRR